MPRLSNATFLGLFAWWVCLVGCNAPHRPPPEVARDTLCWSKNISHGRDAWLAEAKTRWPHPFVFVVHGNTEDRMNWWVAPDARYAKANIEAVGKLLHDLMPDRDVVLISCDSWAVTPRLPKRVWYCKRAVWSCPARYCFQQPPCDVASEISEFIEGTEQ